VVSGCLCVIWTSCIVSREDFMGPSEADCYEYGGYWTFLSGHIMGAQPLIPCPGKCVTATAPETQHCTGVQCLNKEVVGGVTCDTQVV
jgi:hypothetical protein